MAEGKSLRMERKLAAILAVDVVGYSALMETDEAGTFERLRARRKELFEPEINRHHGRIFKVMGDGLLAEFGSVVEAVECAVTLQRGMAERNVNVNADKRISVRIGINLGEVIVDGDDRYGEGVNVAARLQEIAEPGGICVSAKVSKEVEKKLAFGFEPMGEQRVKNIAEPIACFRVNLRQALSARSDAITIHEASSKKATIAVLPFLNMSGDPEQEYFADGITEDIITDLSKISGLSVIARNNVFVFKGKSIKVQQVAQELGVRYVLEGSIRKSGARVRITGQLIDAADGTHVWAERYDRELTDIFAIQDDIRGAIIDQLRVKLLPAEKKAAEGVPTENVEAYTYYLRGRQFSRVGSKSYLLLARRMFSKAVELDPAYARAFAGIADCDSMLHVWHNANVSVEHILKMSRKALDLDPSLAEAHASCGVGLNFGGRQEEAKARFERALALDPNLYEANYFYGRFLFERGDYAKAAECFEKACQIRSDDYRCPVLLSRVYASLGKYEDRKRSARLGLERAERELTQHPENSDAAQMGALALAHLGERDRAKDWAGRTLAMDPEDMNALYNIACVYSQLGEADQAVVLLERVFPYLDAAAANRAWFEHDSDLDPLRSISRFQELMAAIGTGRVRLETSPTSTA
jgi:adenylate cyclase